MSATQTTDVIFQPKVWSDHVTAYWRRKLGLGQFALIDETLTAQPGDTVCFPYFKNIGDAQEPREDEGLIVDALGDDAFQVTVKEVGKAVGWKDAAIRKSSASRAAQEAEAQTQIARVFAEKVDRDLVTTMSTAGAYTNGLVASSVGDNCNIRNVLRGKIMGFGDRQDEAVALVMHSYHYLDLMTDTTAGFLQANANDPFWGTAGFIGRLLGMAVFTFDQMPRQADIGGKQVYDSYILKANPFGIYKAEEMKMEKDRDILHREDIIASTMWYGTLSLHAKQSVQDLRVVRNVFATSVSA